MKRNRLSEEPENQKKEILILVYYNAKILHLY